VREVSGRLLGDEPQRLLQSVAIENRIGHGETLDRRAVMVAVARARLETKY
jgi:hypothetical protein